MATSDNNYYVNHVDIIEDLRGCVFYCQAWERNSVTSLALRIETAGDGIEQGRGGWGGWGSPPGACPCPIPHLQRNFQKG